MSNPTYDAILDKIESITNAIERRNNRLEKLASLKPTTRIKRRMDRLQSFNERADRQIDNLRSQLKDFEPELPEGPKDSMEVSFWQDPVTGNKYGLKLSITDTGLDDTYIGGSDLTVKVTGSGYQTRFGTRSFRRTLTDAVSNQIAPVDETTTLGVFLPTRRIDGSYPDLNVTLVDDNDNIVFSQMVYQNGEVLI